MTTASTKDWKIAERVGFAERVGKLVAENMCELLRETKDKLEKEKSINKQLRKELAKKAEPAEPKAEKPEPKAEKAEPARKHSELLSTDPKKNEFWWAKGNPEYKVLIVDVRAFNNVWKVGSYQVDGEVRGCHEIKYRDVGLFTELSFGYEKMPAEAEREFKRDQFERVDRLRKEIERKHPRNASATAAELVRAAVDRKELLREALIKDGSLNLMLYFLEHRKKPTDKQPAEPKQPEPTASTKRKRTDEDVIKSVKDRNRCLEAYQPQTFLPYTGTNQ